MKLNGVDNIITDKDIIVTFDAEFILQFFFQLFL